MTSVMMPRGLSISGYKEAISLQTAGPATQATQAGPLLGPKGPDDNRARADSIVRSIRPRDP